MKILRILLILVVVSFSGKAQSSVADSLLQLVKTAVNDTSQITFRNLLINEYYESYPDSALKNAKELFQLSEALNFTRGMAVSLIHQGRSYTRKGDFLKALDCLLNSLTHTGYYDAMKITAITYFEIAKVYSEFHNLLHADAIARNGRLYNQKAIRLLEKMQYSADPDLSLMLAGAHLETGRAYMHLRAPDSDNFDSAYYHYRRALNGFQKNKLSYLIGSVYQDLAMLFVRQEKYDSALAMSRKMLESFNDSDSRSYLPAAYGLISRTHARMNNYDSAHWYADYAIRLGQSSDKQQFLSNAYEVKGEVLFQEKRYAQSIQYYLRLLQMSKQRGDLLGREVAYTNLTECYKNLKDYRNAFHYHELGMKQSDSVSTEQDVVRMENLQALFESSQKQKEIELLASQAKVNEVMLRRNQFIALAIGSFLLLALVAIVVIVRQNRKIKTADKERAKLFGEMDRMKSRFFANISHEFRTPLTLMLTPLERRIREASSDNDRNEWQMMQNNGNRLLNLVNQLLDLSKIEAGKMTLHLERIDLAAWLRPLAGQFTSIALSRSIHFNVRLSHDLIWALDRDKMEQVLLNLLSNAFKFTNNGGTIELTVLQQAANVHFTVRDSGIGIPEEHVNRIFDRFYQVDDAQVHEGSGIGLALANELVQLHGGKIAVNSEYGRGSAFIVMLPDHPEVKEVYELKTVVPKHMHETEVGSAPEAFELESDPRPCVLVVEDNTDLRNYMSNELGKRYRVLLAANGQEGIDLAQQIPDLIISDLMMPIVNGLDLCRQIKSGIKTSHIPVILLTAKADQEEKTEGLQTGADDYIPKPFHLIELLARVQNLIDSRKRLRILFSSQISLKPSDIQGQSMEDRFMKMVLEAIEENLSNTQFSVESLADAVAMSTVQLYRKLKAITGKAPNEVIRDVRLERAAAMFEKKLGTVAEIAYEVGFNNLSYFSKCFKEKFGSTPSDFGKKNRSA